jgi:preprotein translocase subunit SecE
VGGVILPLHATVPARIKDQASSTARKDACVAQTRPSQPNQSRVGLNREQARRGAANTQSAAARPSMPLAGAGGRRGRGGTPIQFLHDVRSELRKVAWPTQRETINLTVVVVALSAVVGLFLGGVDFLFQEFFRFLLGLTGSGSF